MVSCIKLNKAFLSLFATGYSLQLVCKQISSNSFKNEITYKLFTYKSYMYIHSNVCKKMSDVGFDVMLMKPFYGAILETI